MEVNKTTSINIKDVLITNNDEKEQPVKESIVVKTTMLENHGYSLGKTIGSGSYGKVHLCYSKSHGCPVAIKIITKNNVPLVVLQKFLPREISVVRIVRHENLIKYYQYIETSSCCYLIMQYVENGSLLDMLKEKGSLDENRSKQMFSQLISAVDYLHNRGIVHRDIKCENMLFDQHYNIKLIDFGFTRENMKCKSSKPVLSETYCGSYAYGSPEILQGIPYDPQYSDTWSCGVVLYAMVYGRLPFNDSNYLRLVKLVQKKIAFPNKPIVSAACKNLIQQILSPLNVRAKISEIRLNEWLLKTPSAIDAQLQKS